LPPLLAAPFVGSFLGVLIRRLPAGGSVALARSECEACHRILSPVDLVPILSFLALRGRCRTCRAPIARFHLTIELAALAVASWAASAATDPARLWADCGLGWTLLALAWIDMEHLVLPDALTLPLVVAGLSVTWWLMPDDLTAHALGAIAGYAAFRAIALIYRALRGQDGLGEGDAKLLAAAGAWVGLAALPRLVFGAALLGIVMTLISRPGILPARNRVPVPAKPVPFGPALALALFIARLYR
jgi:leader peptidase (prepilin peptidase)/N-methyltransferase